jgi:hypothetical protein
MFDLDSLATVLLVVKLALEVRDLLRKGGPPRGRGDADSLR